MSAQRSTLGAAARRASYVAQARVICFAGVKIEVSDRVAPDYRNSVKESISAVEAACRHVTGLSSATLADALKKVSDIHPAYSKAFGQLYGYTSDASGIRHSLTDEPIGNLC